MLGTLCFDSTGARDASVVVTPHHTLTTLPLIKWASRLVRRAIREA